MIATPHAVRRFRERVRPWLDEATARAALLRLAARAHVVRPARDGAVVMRTPRPERLRLIVAGDVIVTIETRCDADMREVARREEIVGLFRDAQHCVRDRARAAWAAREAREDLHPSRYSPSYRQRLQEARARRNGLCCEMCGEPIVRRRTGPLPRYCGERCKARAASERRSRRRAERNLAALRARQCVWCGDAIERMPRSGCLPRYCTEECRGRAKRARRG